MPEGYFKLKYKITSNVHVYNCVVNSLAYAGFQQTDGASWNILWSAPLKVEQIREFDEYKHVNHFAGTWYLGRKDFMYRNIAHQIRDFGAEYQIVPKTWILPNDARTFQNERDASEGQHKYWILKPANSSCGRGIKLINKSSNVPKSGQWVVN